MKIYLPLLETGNEKIDQAFRMACGDLTGNLGMYQSGILPQASPVIFAGIRYPSPWTRDAAFNTWYAGFIAPEAAKNSLLSVLENRAGKLHISEACHQYWDQIIWALGAWHYYCYTADTDFLKLALTVIENSLAESRCNEWDDADGLFRGGACFQDGVSAYPDCFVSRHARSGILDYVTDPALGARIAPKGGGLPMKALSTNCLYYAAYRIADRMRRLLGMPPQHDPMAAQLKQAINRYFYQPSTGRYRYLLDAGDTIDRQEGLGTAFALLFEIVPADCRSRLIAETHITPHGLPCVWPQYERYAAKAGDYARHSGVIWPQVNAAWCGALVQHNSRRQAWQETENLAAMALKNDMFHEIYHPETGSAYGGLQENGADGIISWESCPRQSWAATGFIQMVLTTLLGIACEPDAVSFDPFLPPGWDEIKLTGLYYQNTMIDVTVRRKKLLKKTAGCRSAMRFLPRPGETLKLTFEFDYES